MRFESLACRFKLSFRTITLFISHYSLLFCFCYLPRRRLEPLQPSASCLRLPGRLRALTAPSMAPIPPIRSARPSEVRVCTDIFYYINNENVICCFIFLFAQKKTRTSMLLKALVPETSVSTNSTIWAYHKFTIFIKLDQRSLFKMYAQNNT